MKLYGTIIILVNFFVALFNALFNKTISTVWAICGTLLCTICVITIDAIIALIFSRLSNNLYNENRKIYNISKRQIKIYEKLGIKSWKDKVLELGALNHFSKSKIDDPKNNEYLHKFLIESVKGIEIHLLSSILGFIVLVVPMPQTWYQIGLYVAITNFVLNIMPLMILQYNIPKLKTLIKFNERHNKSL